MNNYLYFYRSNFELSNTTIKNFNARLKRIGSINISTIYLLKSIIISFQY